MTTKIRVLGKEEAAKLHYSCSCSCECPVSTSDHGKCSLCKRGDHWSTMRDYLNEVGIGKTQKARR